MNENSAQIIDCIRKYLEENPSIRFTQALFNLDINKFADEGNPAGKDFLLRDPYNDSDQKVLERIKNKNEQI